MDINFDDERKDLPCEQLERLFLAAGWTDGSYTAYMNRPFINATLVVSAWKADLLLGVVRVLSDQIGRSVIYDLVVDPEWRGQGIGKELVKRCMQHFPNSEWLVGTTKEVSGYYEKMGFHVDAGVFLSIPSIYQKTED